MNLSELITELVNDFSGQIHFMKLSSKGKNIFVQTHTIFQNKKKKKTKQNKTKNTKKH